MTLNERPEFRGKTRRPTDLSLGGKPLTEFEKALTGQLTEQQTKPNPLQPEYWDQQPVTRREFPVKLLAGLGAVGVTAAGVYFAARELVKRYGQKILSQIELELAQGELITAASERPLFFQIVRPEEVAATFQSAPLDQAPADLPKPKDEELKTAPSVDELLFHVPNLITAILGIDTQVLVDEAKWLREEAPVQARMLSEKLFLKAAEVIREVPAVLVIKMGITSLLLHPTDKQKEAVGVLLSSARVVEAEREAQRQAAEQAALKAAEEEAAKGEPGQETQPNTQSQPEVSTEGVQVETPQEILENLANEAAEEESGKRKWLPGPVALPFLGMGWFGRDWADYLINRFRVFLGLADLGEATYKVLAVGKITDVLPPVFRKSLIGQFVNLQILKLEQTKGALKGKGGPSYVPIVYIVKFAEIEVGDEFQVKTAGEIACEFLSSSK